jgi:hypothetical protein
VRGIIDQDDFLGSETRELYHLLTLSSSLLPLHEKVPNTLIATAERAVERITSAYPKDEQGWIKDVVQAAVRLKRTRILQTQSELTLRIDAAVRAGDDVQVRELALQMSELQKVLRTLYKTSPHTQS